MTKRHPILAAATFLVLGTAGATAGELPSYDIAGFPITPLQMSVLGQSGETRERAAAPMLMHDDMPASPHQIAVLSRRQATTALSTQASAETQIGAVTRAQ